jgi:hypothetical protein
MPTDTADWVPDAKRTAEESAAVGEEASRGGLKIAVTKKKDWFGRR